MSLFCVDGLNKTKQNKTKPNKTKNKQQCYRAFLCIQMYTHITRTYISRMTYKPSRLFSILIGLPRMQCCKIIHILHPALLFHASSLSSSCLSTISVALISASVIRIMANGQRNVSFSFFLQKRYEISVEEKITTSRLIIESKRCIPITRSQYKCRNNQ